MTYTDHIETRKDVLGGKPIFKGTRISVEIILSFLAAGWTEEQIVENYPRLSRDHLRAMYGLAHELVTEERFIIESKVA
ncbi:DUF433 domain-containing protein [Sphingomonas bacterium]|uniref:DUF433 domain-containing protein n=1 Tax=Sphingomonas bacterium TaxID=1895847 RepID=UPI001575DBFF|nr:DUF433 domain-containing protein [Sphingomonas bacterium]